MSNEIEIAKGVSPDEIAHAQRTEQMEAIYQELNWLTSLNLPQTAQGLVGMLWDRVSFVNQQAEIAEQRVTQWQAVAQGAMASAAEFQQQRDAVLDEMNDLLNGNHPAIQQMIEEAKQQAFEEYQANAGRLIALAERINRAEKRGA